jgi:hypothetical protein
MYTLNASTGVVTRDSDGAQVAPIDNPNNVNYLDYIAWIDMGNSPKTVYEAVIETAIVTKLAFRNRFSIEEKVKIELLTENAPDDTQELKTLRAGLKVFMEDMSQAEFIDLKSEGVQMAIGLMVKYEVITSERGEVILTSPILPHEIPG